MCDRLGCDSPKVRDYYINYIDGKKIVFCDKCYGEWRKVFKRLTIGDSISNALRKFVNEGNVWSVS